MIQVIIYVIYYYAVAVIANNVCNSIKSFVYMLLSSNENNIHTVVRMIFPTSPFVVG
jgi:hypothetical protein